MTSYDIMCAVYTGVGDTASHPLRHTAMVLIDTVAKIQDGKIEGPSDHVIEGELNMTANDAVCCVHDIFLKLNLFTLRLRLPLHGLHSVPGSGALSPVRHGSAPQPRRQSHLHPGLGGRGPGHQGLSASQVR